MLSINPIDSRTLNFRIPTSDLPWPLPLTPWAFFEIWRTPFPHVLKLWTDVPLSEVQDPVQFPTSQMYAPLKKQWDQDQFRPLWADIPITKQWDYILLGFTFSTLFLAHLLYFWSIFRFFLNFHSNLIDSLEEFSCCCVGILLVLTWQNFHFMS